MSNMFVVERVDWKRNIVKLEKEFPDKAKEDIFFALVSGAQEIRNEMILSMRNTPKTGKTYKWGSVSHIASSPGKPPAIDTGNLIQSLLVDVRNNEIEVGSVVSVRGKSLEYPPYLEFGAATATKKGGFKQAGVGLKSVLFPRPFMGPAVDKISPNIENDILRAVIDSAKKVLK